MVELKGQFERRLEKPLVIFAPDDKGIIENTAVHADGTVYLCIDDRRGADHHAVGQIVIFTAFRNRARQAQIVGIEPRKVIRKRHIAGADIACLVFHDGIDSDVVVFQ